MDLVSDGSQKEKAGCKGPAGMCRSEQGWRPFCSVGRMGSGHGVVGLRKPEND